MFVFAAVLLFSIIPSQVAFTSLISAGGVPTIAAYALIAALRFTCTPHAFKTSHFYLGRWAKPMYLATVLFNLLVFAVRHLARFTSPSSRTVTSYNRGGWSHRSRSHRSTTRSRPIRSTLPAPSLARCRSSRSSLGTSYLRTNGCAKNRSSAPCARLKVTPTPWSHRPSFRKETQSERPPSRLKDADADAYAMPPLIIK